MNSEDNCRAKPIRLSDITIRKALLDDLDLIYQNECLAYPHPWSEGMIWDSLVGNHQCLVMACNGKIIGHMIYQVVLDEINLFNLCVIPNFQGAGLGAHWLDCLKEKATDNKAVKINLEVRISNIVAKKLYLSNGFEEVVIRKDFYQASGKNEDGLVMVAKL